MESKATFKGFPGRRSYFYVEHNGLVARFPGVYEGAQKEILFRRTLRVPNDGKVYALPAGLGLFPLRHLEDYEEELPRAWADRGGLIMPMHIGEAMYIELGDGFPCAVKIGAGKINVLNGNPWTERLDSSECDYIVAPPQPALDGFRTDKADVVRQFVAVPFGEGDSVEQQLTGEARHGGLQIVVHPMKKKRFAQLPAEPRHAGGDDWGSGSGLDGMMSLADAPEPRVVEIAAGGRMKERIYEDPYGVDAWDQAARTRCIVTLMEAGHWRRLTLDGRMHRPFTSADYEEAGLPWFEYYNEDLRRLDEPSGLGGIKGVAEADAGMGDGAIDQGEVVQLRPVKRPRRSRHPSPTVRAFWSSLGLFRRR